jgi:hypothetical protein
MDWLGPFLEKNGIAITVAILTLLFLGLKVWPDLMKRLDQARADLLAQQVSKEAQLAALQMAYEARMAEMRADHAKDQTETRVEFLQALAKVTEATTGAIKENTAEIRRIRLKDKVK